MLMLTAAACAALLLCSKPCDARDLHPNPALREVLEKYGSARPLLLHLMHERHQAGAAGVSAQLEPSARRRRPPRQPGSKRRHGEQQHFEAVVPAAGEGGRRQTRSTSAQQAAPTAAAAVSGAGKLDLADDSSSRGEQDASEASASEASSSSSSSDFSSGSGDASSSAEGSPSSFKRQRRSGPAKGTLRGRQSTGTAARQQQQQGAGPQQVQAVPPADTPPGFVRCPVCSKAVPSFYINSHVDLCLIGGSRASGGAAHSQPGKPATLRVDCSNAQQQRVAAAAHPGPFEPLAVPAKIVPGLATDKSLRALLKKYGLPTDGKKKVGASAVVPVYLQAWPDWQVYYTMLQSMFSCLLSSHAGSGMGHARAAPACLRMFPPSLSADGSAVVVLVLQELLERYQKLRLAVEMANDKQVQFARVIGSSLVFQTGRQTGRQAGTELLLDILWCHR